MHNRGKANCIAAVLLMLIRTYMYICINITTLGCNVIFLIQSLTNTAAAPIPVPMHMEVTRTCRPFIEDNISDVIVEVDTLPFRRASSLRPVAT